MLLSYICNRWGSTYMMLTSLLHLREFCDTCFGLGNTNVYLSNDEWAMIQEIHMSLEPSFKCTKRLQTEDLALTDVYKLLNICHMDTAVIGK